VQLAVLETDIQIGLPAHEVMADPYLHSDRPLARLRSYLQALHTICQQALYSMERLQVFHAWFTPPGGPGFYEFYAFHYVFDFFARVKAATDLIALTINNVFGLGLVNEECSLEKGKLSNRLREKRNDQRQLAANLDRARNDWVSVAYDMRNLITHRSGLRFMMNILKPGVHLVGGSEEQRILGEFLAKARAGGVSSDQTTADLDAICEWLWAQLISLVEDTIGKCQTEIEVLIASEVPHSTS
jgi:hypothetical protein